MMFKKILSSGLLAASICFATAASSAVVIFGQDTGSDVVFTYSGSIDTTGLTQGGSSNSSLGWIGSLGPIDRFYAMNGYTGWRGAVTVDNTFGVALNQSGVATGNALGFEQGFVWLGRGYTSGSAINGTLTFANTSIAALGFTVGQSFIATLPNDTITLNIGTVSAVPLPAGLPLLLAGFGALGILSRRKIA